MLEIIIVTILIATVLNLLLKSINIPTIIGYIATGVCITYIFQLGSVSANHHLHLIAEFGIVFLMFTIGLEFSIKHLWKLRKFVFVFGGMQFLYTSLIFYTIGTVYFGLDFKSGIIIGTGLALSSTAIVLKILNENKEINKRYGQKALGILLFQDLAVIPILLMISIFVKQDASIGVLLGETLVASIILFTFLWLIGKYVLNIFLEKIDNTKSNEIFVASILLIVIGASYFAHFLGLSYSLGALIAGIMIAETDFKHQVESELIPFRDILLGIFFITVGMQLDYSIILDNGLLIFSLLFILLFIKALIIFVTLGVFGSKKAGLKTALSLFQIGEFGIVILELANSHSLLPSGISQILIVVIILSMIITPFVLNNIDRIADFFIKEKSTEFTKLSNLENHIIIVGYGRTGRMLGDFFSEQNKEHIVLSSDLKNAKQAKKDGKRLILGKTTNGKILKSCGIENADFVIVSLGFGKNIYLTIKKILKFIEKEYLIVKVETFKEKDQLSSFNLPHIIVETEETALTIIESMKEEE